MKKLIIIALILFGISPFADAQLLNLNYQISVPIGKMKNFTDKASFRGMDLEYHHFFNEHFSLGGMIGWNVFYHHLNHHTDDFKFTGDDDIYAITGDQYRYINTVPIMAVPRYYFTDNTTSVRPYAGLGIGTRWTEKRLEVGQYSYTLSRWQFSFAPEVGMYVPLTDQIALNFGARYSYGTRASHGRIPEFQSFAFSIGLIFMGQNY